MYIVVNSICIHALDKMRHLILAAAFKECDDIIEGDINIGSQYHFYLEPHVCKSHGELYKPLWPGFLVVENIH